MLTLPFPEGAEEEVLEPAEAHPETGIRKGSLPDLGRGCPPDSISTPGRASV